MEACVPDIIAVEAVDEHVASEVEEVDGGCRHRHFAEPNQEQMLELRDEETFASSRLRVRRWTECGAIG